MNKLYTATVTATGGREGRVQSAEGAFNLEIRSPKALGGRNDDYANPEILFAAGYAACFGSALDGVIRKQKVQAGNTTVTAEVSLGKLNETAYGLAVKLDVNIPNVKQETAEELVKTAHQVCPYSNATRNNVEVELHVTTEDV